MGHGRIYHRQIANLHYESRLFTCLLARYGVFSKVQSAPACRVLKYCHNSLPHNVSCNESLQSSCTESTASLDKQGFLGIVAGSSHSRTPKFLQAQSADYQIETRQEDKKLYTKVTPASTLKVKVSAVQRQRDLRQPQTINLSSSSFLQIAILSYALAIYLVIQSTTAAVCQINYSSFSLALIYSLCTISRLISSRNQYGIVL